uniref:Uncharacterized protein n=1 Tax=Tetranychus urticae TaxID=32264 RepID=T1L1S7_TETUR
MRSLNFPFSSMACDDLGLGLIDGFRIPGFESDLDLRHFTAVFYCFLVAYGANFSLGQASDVACFYLSQMIRDNFSSWCMS